MGVLIDLTGKQFGKWQVLYKSGMTANKASVWRCKCTECGKEYDIVGATLRSGKSTKCLACSARATKTKPFSKDPIKIIFMGMKQRCYNEKHIAYKHYGARGIKIYTEWLENPQSFYEWAYNNGYTKGMSIDRINANGNYEPSNCRFITMAEQQENRRINIMIEIDGEKKCLQEWCDIYHINRNTIVSRVKRNGITYEEALKQKKK